MVFTENKAELRRSIEQSGDRDLALEMKRSVSGSSQRWGLKRLPEWTRRALAAAERMGTHEKLMQRYVHNAKQTKITL